ncbi:(2Fe-2S)-binding protein [Salicola sp. Rm-C-2C1-2]|uniref:(2Fe-2S)-binding protein n=1 Tax=Salicola sp. Rm-C-2C1-2 TaxID=3141321 RepID=UPI0032E44551
MTITIRVNDTEQSVAAPGDTPLLWVLRDWLGLKGTKFGCGIGQCGACTVHIDGEAKRSCITPVSKVAGGDAAVTTIEGLADGDDLHPVQEAWVEHNVPQCGYCQSGQIMSAVALLNQETNPDDERINEFMSGNLCRCGTYPRIHAAIRSVADGGGS